MADVEPMGAYLERIAAEHNGDVEVAFDGVKRDFISAPPQVRAQWLYGWRQSMAEEHRVTREHAEYLTKQRELETIHAALKKAGR